MEGQGLLLVAARSIYARWEDDYDRAAAETDLVAGEKWFGRIKIGPPTSVEGSTHVLMDPRRSEFRLRGFKLPFDASKMSQL